jgi:2-hydroxychromene-2-carboxylate isomerase
MLASLLGDQGRLDDPHLWRRAEALGLDLKRFEADRRAPSTRERVRRDVEAGLGAGVAGTLAVFRDGREVGVDDL